MHADGGDIVQIGIVSWGPSCSVGRHEGYGAYAAVAFFAPWIRRVVGDASFGAPDPVTDHRPEPPAIEPPGQTVPSGQSPGQNPAAVPAQTAVVGPAQAPSVTPSHSGTQIAENTPPPGSPAIAPPQGPELVRPAPATKPPMWQQSIDQFLNPSFAVPPGVPPSRVGQLYVDIIQGNRLPVGTEAVLRVTSTVTGYLVVGVIDPDGHLYQIFPNQWSTRRVNGERGTTIQAGRTVDIPGPSDNGFVFTLTPPAGHNRIIAAVLPPGEQLSQLTNRSLDLKPVSSPAAWIAGLGAIALKARGKVAVPTTIAVGSCDFDIVPR